MPNLKATLIDQSGKKRIVPAQGAKFNTGERLMTPDVLNEIETMKQSVGSAYNPQTGKGLALGTNDEMVNARMAADPSLSRDAAMGSILTEFLKKQPEPQAATDVTPAVNVPASNVNQDTTQGVGVNTGINIDGTNINLADLLKGNFGGDVTTSQPDTSALDAQIQGIEGQLQSPQDIDATLQSELAAIDARYDRQNKIDQQKIANSIKTQMSDLAGVSTNPLSSGGGSIQRAGDESLAQILAQNNALREAEKAAARQRAQGLKTEGLKDALSSALRRKQEIFDRSDTDFSQRQTLIQNSVRNLNTVVGLLDRQRNITEGDKNSARNDIQTLFDSLGSKAFVETDSQTIRKLESAAGLPYGTIDLMRNSYAKQEQAAQQQAEREYELEERDFALDQAKVLKTFTDSYGNVTAYNPFTGESTNLGRVGKGLKSLVAPSGSGSGGRAKKFTDAFESWYFDTFGTFADINDEDAQAEFERYEKTGGSTGLKSRTKAQEVEELQNTNPFGYTDQELRKLRAVGIDPTDQTESDAYLYPDKREEGTGGIDWSFLE